MSIWSPTYQQSVFKRYHSGKHFSEFLLTRRRQKSSGTDMEQNYVTVILSSRTSKIPIRWKFWRHFSEWFWKCFPTGVLEERNVLVEGSTPCLLNKYQPSQMDPRDALPRSRHRAVDGGGWLVWYTGRRPSQVLSTLCDRRVRRRSSLSRWASSFFELGRQAAMIDARQLLSPEFGTTF